MKIPPCLRLAKPDPRMIAPGEFFSRSTQDLLDFFLAHAVIMDMR